MVDMRAMQEETDGSGMIRGIYGRAVVVALGAMLALAAPAAAQLPFTDSRQAASDQYSVPPQVQQQQQQGTAGVQSGSNPQSTPAQETKEERAGSDRNRRTSAGGTAPAKAAKPIAVSAPSNLGADDAGRLPFTGFGLGLVALIGLLLLALGCLIALAERARRSRQGAVA